MTLEPITVDEIVSFILRFRTGDAFMEESPDQLRIYIQCAILEQCCVVDYEPFERKIFGVILAKQYPERKNIHIYGILCVKHRSLIQFAKWLQSEVSERKYWCITATRRGRVIEYDTQKILGKLSRKKV